MTDRLRFAKTCRRAGVVVDLLLIRSDKVWNFRHTGINSLTTPGKDNVALMLDVQGLVLRVAGFENRNSVALFNHSGTE